MGESHMNSSYFPGFPHEHRQSWGNKNVVSRPILGGKDGDWGILGLKTSVFHSDWEGAWICNTDKGHDGFCADKDMILTRKDATFGSKDVSFRDKILI